MYYTCLVRGNPKRTLQGTLARSDYKVYTSDYSTKPPSTKPPITSLPRDSRGCHSVTRTYPNVSEARPMSLRYERRKVRDVDEWRKARDVSGELPLTYLPFYSLLSSLSILHSLISSTSTGSISSDCDHYGHSHVM
jgi:hypothetical protein